MFLILVIPVIAQQNIELLPSTKEITVLSGETGTIDLTIKNNLNKKDTFSISIFPSFWKGISAFPEKNTVSIEAKSNSSVKIYFSTLLETEESIQIFSVSLISVTDTNISSTIDIQVRVQKKSPIFITDLTLSKSALDPEETLTINIEVTNVANLASEPHRLKTSIEKDGKLIKEFENLIPTVQAKSSKIISINYTFGKYVSTGKYSVNSVLQDSLNKTVDKRSAEFKINAMFKLPTEYTEKTRSIGIFSISVKIRIKNEGNVPTPEFYIMESIPSFAKSFFKPEISPTFVNKTDNRIIYGWFFSPLDPDQEVIINYRFDLLPVCIAVIFIIIVVYILFSITLKPLIIKKHKYVKAEKEISISLDVKNRCMSEIKDVTIKDFVPPLVQLVEKFDTLRPKTKKIRHGVELTWKFDSLKPREERVLTYRIKPAVEVIGTLKLSSTTLTYVDRKGVKRSVKSRILLIKPK